MCFLRQTKNTLNFKDTLMVDRILHSCALGCLILLMQSCVSVDYSMDYSIDLYVEYIPPDIDYDVYGSHHSIDTTSIMWQGDAPFIQHMRERAYQMAKIQWTPLDTIPQRNEGFFLPQKTYTGMIYSSVKEMNKYVGQDVSFYTFLSAVSNPRSVLYTERVDTPPYRGRNCAAYYGTVCSTAIDYALGLERPYPANYYQELPFFKRVVKQDFRYCSPGDVVWRDGHVVLITDVRRNEQNNIETIEILESIGAITSIKTYSLEQFEERWRDHYWILYRYSMFGREWSDDSVSDVFLGNNCFEHTPTIGSLCCSRGDKAAYRQGEDVIINVFSEDFSMVELKNLSSGSCVTQGIKGTPDICFSGLDPGLYSVCLLGGKNSSRSEECSFEVIDTSVGVRWSGRTLNIEFSSSNAEPDFIVFCNDYGAYFYFSDITREERVAGEKKIYCLKSVNGLYLKVHFKGEYGRVSNIILPISGV